MTIRTRRTRQSYRFAACAVVLSSTLVTGITGGVQPVSASIGNPSDAVAVVIEGQGNGHGRGLSQYGSLGWATIHNRDWTWILDHYYGGTIAGTAPAGLRITVALAAHDGRQTAVVAGNSDATWVGGTAGSFGSLVAREVASTGTTATYKVWGNSKRTCPSAADSLSSWRYLGEMKASVLHGSSMASSARLRCPEQKTAIFPCQ